MRKLINCPICQTKYQREVEPEKELEDYCNNCKSAFKVAGILKMDYWIRIEDIKKYIEYNQKKD